MAYITLPGECAIHSVLNASYVRTIIPIIPQMISIASVVEDSVPRSIPITLASTSGIGVSDSLAEKSQNDVRSLNIKRFIR